MRQAFLLRYKHGKLQDSLYAIICLEYQDYSTFVAAVHPNILPRYLHLSYLTLLIAYFHVERHFAQAAVNAQLP